MAIRILAAFCLAFASNEAFSDNSVDKFECQGAYWRYHYQFTGNGSSDSCMYAREQTKGFPGRPVGANGKPKLESMDTIECWKTMARVQVVGARCCLSTKSGQYTGEDVPNCEK